MIQRLPPGWNLMRPDHKHQTIKGKTGNRLKKDRRFFTLTLRSRLFLAITFSYMFLMLFFVYYASHHVSNILIRSFEDKQQSRLEQSINAFEQVIMELDRVTLYLSGDRNLANLLISEPQERFESLQLARRISESVSNHTSYTSLSSHVPFVTVFYLDELYENAAPLSSFSLLVSVERVHSDTQVYNSSAVRDHYWYQTALKARVQVRHFIDPELPDYVMFTKLVKNADLGAVSEDNVAGVVVFAVHKSEIAKILAMAGTTHHTNIMLIDHAEQLLAAHLPDAETIPEQLPRSYKSLRAIHENGVFTNLNIDGIDCLGVKYNVMNQWELLASVRISEITQQLHNLTIWLSVVVAVSLLLVFLIAAFLASYFSRPIQHLSQVMQQLNNEEEMKTLPINMRSRDEVYNLYTSYNAMINRIHQLMADVKDRAEQQKMAEFRALQAQINPHFLYNTLDTINWIARDAGQKEITTMVTAMVAIMRYSLRDPESLVTLEDEIQYLREYWQIQQIRYQDQFVLSIQVPEQLRSYLLPKMSLQPLIENALNYADSNDEKITIDVMAEDLGDDILLTVTDSGRSVDVDKINRYLHYEETIKSKSTGLGIRNVNERIKMTFGPQYGLSYQLGKLGLQARLLIGKS